MVAAPYRFPLTFVLLDIWMRGPHLPEFDDHDQPHGPGLCPSGLSLSTSAPVAAWALHGCSRFQVPSHSFGLPGSAGGSNPKMVMHWSRYQRSNSALRIGP